MSCTRPPITATEIDAPRVFDTLVNAHGMWQPQFDELCPRKTRIMAYRGALGLSEHDDDTRITMLRLAVCLEQRKANASWAEAIRVALETVPDLATA